MKKSASKAILVSVSLLLCFGAPSLRSFQAAACFAAQSKTVKSKRVHRSTQTRQSQPARPAVAKSLDPVKSAKAKEMLAQGTKKFKQGSHYEAEAFFKSVLCIDPNNADAFYNLGALKEHRQDLVEALSNYRAALALKPQDKQIQEAVHSVELAISSQGELGMQADQADSSSPFLGVAPDFRKQKVLTDLFPDRRPYDVVDGGSDSTAAPSGDGPFKLRGQQDALNAGAGTSTLPVVPVVQAPAQQPVVQQTKSRPVVRAAVNQALNVGTSYALRSVGLHCPLCHIVRFRF